MHILSDLWAAKVHEHVRIDGVYDGVHDACRLALVAVVHGKSNGLMPWGGSLSESREAPFLTSDRQLEFFVHTLFYIGILKS